MASLVTACNSEGGDQGRDGPQTKRDMNTFYVAIYYPVGYAFLDALSVRVNSPQ